MIMQPLAYRVRPKKLSEYVGQSHLVGEGKILLRMLAKNQLVSMVFVGNPGVGKTTLAKLLAGSLNWQFIELSAVQSGVKDIKLAVNKALESEKGTVLFLDEIHRFNKAQQDALLPHVENGTLVLIGATTENPFFAINNALLSRMTVLRLNALSLDDIKSLVQHALITDEILKEHQISMDSEVIEHLYHISDGDSRRVLNLIESMFIISDPEEKRHHFTVDLLKSVAGEYAHKMDKGGDYFYDQLSAFHKSVRGSDPDAAVFWLANMIESGADPLVIARRMLCIASEDIGNADPKALTIALDAWQSYERLGLPEGRLPLIQAAIYLAVAPKSNASYLAYKSVFKDLKAQTQIEVPYHLRNIEVAGSAQVRAQYKYPHDYPNAYVKQQYLPDGVLGGYYKPNNQGLEIKISEKLKRLR